ncbi:MAG: YSIRK-targeted surface antigen transcriptional regulator [[Clostridium] innocuum]|nr:YSIRK-targeted surface antigen transcriptional regulator [[Clostridium] innocuum]
MELTGKELQNIKALHVTTKIPVYIYDLCFKLLKVYNSGNQYEIPYDFTLINTENTHQRDFIWYEYGWLKEIFIFVRHKDVIITLGPFLTNHMEGEEIEKLAERDKMKSQSSITGKEWFSYYEHLPIYALGDIRDFVILLGTILNIDLEEVYSKRLHVEVYRNELELKRQVSKKPFFQDLESEQYAFYYENKILELVAKGDLDTLKQGVAKIGCSVIPTWHNDSVRTEKNYTIVILEKLSSLALHMGKDVLETIRLREFYIKKLEQKEKLVDVLAVRDSAIIHFTKELHDLANSAYSPFILSVIQYINLKIYESYNVSDVAKHFFLSESTLRRQFKREMHMSITEYTNQRKVAIAKIFLMAGMPIAECSNRLGFFDSSHFYRTFRKYEGITPKQYLSGSSKRHSGEIYLLDEDLY